MSELSQRYEQWSIKELKRINEKSVIVFDERSGEIMIKKRVDTDNLPVMQKLCLIRHKNLSAVLKITQEDGDYFSYSEFVSGRSIQNLIDSGTIFDEKEAVRIISEVCDGLEVLHKNGVIHRDITASNIILSYDGNVKIIDYGISRSPKHNASRDTYILGTAGYAAPEQFGFAQSDEKTDLYSVGVLLNVMLTGAFPSEKLYPGRLGKIISRCTAIDSEKRYKTVKEVKSAIRGKKEKNKSAKGFPGFRTKNKFIRAAAVILYATILFFEIAFAWVVYSNAGLLHMIIQIILSVVIFALIIFMIFDPNNILSKSKLASSVSEQSLTTIKVVVSTFLILFGFLSTVFLC